MFKCFCCFWRSQCIKLAFTTTTPTNQVLMWLQNLLASRVDVASKNKNWFLWQWTIVHLRPATKSVVQVQYGQLCTSQPAVKSHNVAATDVLQQPLYLLHAEVLVQALDVAIRASKHTWKWIYLVDISPTFKRCPETNRAQVIITTLYHQRVWLNHNVIICSGFLFHILLQRLGRWWWAWRCCWWWWLVWWLWWDPTELTIGLLAANAWVCHFRSWPFIDKQAKFRVVQNKYASHEVLQITNPWPKQVCQRLSNIQLPNKKRLLIILLLELLEVYPNSRFQTWAQIKQPSKKEASNWIISSLVVVKTVNILNRFQQLNSLYTPEARELSIHERHTHTHSNSAIAGNEWPSMWLDETLVTNLVMSSYFFRFLGLPFDLAVAGFLRGVASLAVGSSTTSCCDPVGSGPTAAESGAFCLRSSEKQNMARPTSTTSNYI